MSQIKRYGWLSLSLLLLAKILMLLHLPNFVIPIALALLIFNVFFVKSIANYMKTIDGANLKQVKLVYYLMIVFNLFLVFSMQGFVIPRIINAPLAFISGLFLLWYLIKTLKSQKIKLLTLSYWHFYWVFIGLLVWVFPFHIQVSDYAYSPKIDQAVYSKGTGSLIAFDEAHNNPHGLDGRWYATANLLISDGYQIEALKNTIVDEAVLKPYKIYIVVNPLNEKNKNNWTLPTYPAFTDTEVNNIKHWVEKGGNLLLIVDHMPIPGAAYSMAKAFGFELKNGHAKTKEPKDYLFLRSAYTLTDNLISNGRNDQERVNQFVAFDGSAFKIPEDAQSILTFNSDYFQWEPQSAFDFQSVKPYNINGYSLGAYKTFGKGRVVVYSEAMMFTAQLGAGLSWVKLGMNSEQCTRNYQLFLNTIHYLDGLIN
jgi:hypothetical protein